jgi:predicted nucleic acid-binding protein
MSRRISNASPLVFLAKLQRLDLLRLGADEVLVPTGVLSEVRAKRDAAARQVENCLGDWLCECSAIRLDLLQALPGLGMGEREVIAQALQEGISDVALDDQDARRLASKMGLQPIGTVGILLAAKRQGLLPSLRDEIGRLTSLGFRVSDALYSRALRDAGEADDR